MRFKLLTIDPGVSPSEPVVTTQPVFVPSAQPLNQVTIDKSCVYKLDPENKKFYFWLVGIIRNVSAYKKVLGILLSLDASYTVHIYIHSPGGSISTASAILTAMERSKATIITHNIGMAASCGSLILAFGDKINVNDNTVTMFHNSSFGNMDASHRLQAQIMHTITNTMHLFSMMRDRGVMAEEEITGAAKRGEEYYITSDEMQHRLKECGLWYEGDK